MIKVVDLFCGAGGESAGIEGAAKTMGEKLNLSAVNHWETAIARNRWNKNCNYPYGKIVSCTINFDDKKVKK